MTVFQKIKVKYKKQQGNFVQLLKGQSRCRQAEDSSSCCYGKTSNFKDEKNVWQFLRLLFHCSLQVCCWWFELWQILSTFHTIPRGGECTQNWWTNQRQNQFCSLHQTTHSPGKLWRMWKMLQTLKVSSRTRYLCLSGFFSRKECTNCIILKYV